MRLRSLVIGFVALLLVLIVSVGVFAFVAPMDFTVTARGRLEPARMIRVAFPGRGRLVFLASGARARKGELLAALDATAEEGALKGLSRRVELLERELGLAREELAAGGRERALDISQAEKELAYVKRRIEIERGSLARVDLAIVKAEQEQRILTAALRRSEEAVLSSLMSQGLVTKMELALSKHRAALARLDASQTKLQVERETIRRGLRVEELASQALAQETRLKVLKNRPPGGRSALALQRGMAELKAETERVSAAIREKRFTAPFDGKILSAAGRAGEIVAAGQCALVFADESKLVFCGSAGEKALTDLKPGLKARIRLNHYPSLSFGTVPATLRKMEVRLVPGEPVGCAVTLELGKPLFRITTGLTGFADVIIFRGTLAQYLMRGRRAGRGAGRRAR